mgnify:CR=1 FL=1
MLLLSVLPCMIGGWIFSEDIIVLIMGEAYLEAAPIFRVLLPVLFFGVMASFFSGLGVAFQRPRFYFQGVICGAFLGLLGYLICIPIFKEVGAGVGYVMGELGVAGAGYFLIRKKIKLYYDVKELLIFTCILILTVGVSIAVKQNLNLHHFIYSVMLVAGFYFIFSMPYIWRLIRTQRR